MKSELRETRNLIRPPENLCGPRISVCAQALGQCVLISGIHRTIVPPSVLLSSVTRNSGAPGQNIQAGPSPFLPLFFPPIPFKGLPPEIFVLMYEVYCTLNIKFSAVIQWILSGTRGPLHSGLPRLSSPCPPDCYAAGSTVYLRFPKCERSQLLKYRGERPTFVL